MIIAAVALALALILIVVVVVRTTVKGRATSAVRKRVVSPGLVLRAASRELSKVKAAAQQDGWSPELAGRAAAALRLAGAIALGKPVSQREVAAGMTSTEGEITVGRGLRHKRLALSSAVTSGTPSGPDEAGRRQNDARGSENGANALWNGVSQTLGTFTAVRYSRTSGSGGNGAPDGTALDAALAESQDLVKRIWRNRLVRFGKSQTHALQSTKQTWAR
jgi:hypothetical protein